MARTKAVREQTVVITGASSGIGRETARRFAAKGAAVVLAARNQTALEQLAQEIDAQGGAAHVVPTDVARWSDVEHLAREANNWRGSIDTWVNNAAISSYGMVEDTSVEEIERVIHVTLMGQIYGMKAALPYLRQQRRGTLINVASVLADRAAPLQAAYCAAKHGVRGFTEALRMELRHERSGVNITLILPASMNTHFFQHARSRMGVEPKPIPPVYHPRAVAEAIVYAAAHPRRDIFVGGAGKLIQVMQRISPALVDWYMLQNGRGFKQQQTDEPNRYEDNLYQPLEGSETVEGEFQDQQHATSLYTRIFELHPTAKRLALAAAALGAVGAVALVRDRASDERNA